MIDTLKPSTKTKLNSLLEEITCSSEDQILRQVKDEAEKRPESFSGHPLQYYRFTIYLLSDTYRFFISLRKIPRLKRLLEMCIFFDNSIVTQCTYYPHNGKTEYDRVRPTSVLKISPSFKRANPERKAGILAERKPAAYDSIDFNYFEEISVN